MPDPSVFDMGFAIQSAKGTAASAATFRFPVNGGDVHPTVGKANVSGTTANPLAGASIVSRVAVEGAPTAFCRPRWLGVALYAALGAKAVSGGSDPYTHTITPALTQPWLTIWTGLDTALFQSFVDCRIASLVLEARAGLPLVAKMTVLGLSPIFRTAGQSAVAIETGVPFLHADGLGALKFEGAAVSAIDGWTLTIANGAHFEDALQSAQIAEGEPEITVSVSQIVTSAALFNRFHYGSATPSDGTAHGTANLVLAGSPAGLDLKVTRASTRTLELLLPSLEAVSVDGFAPEMRSGPARVNATYRAFGASAFSALLRNDVAAY